MIRYCSGKLFCPFPLPFDPSPASSSAGITDVILDTDGYFQ